MFVTQYLFCANIQKKCEISSEQALNDLRYFNASISSHNREEQEQSHFTTNVYNICYLHRHEHEGANASA